MSSKRQRVTSEAASDDLAAVEAGDSAQASSGSLSTIERIKFQSNERKLNSTISFLTKENEHLQKALDDVQLSIAAEMAALKAERDNALGAEKSSREELLGHQLLHQSSSSGATQASTLNMWKSKCSAFESEVGQLHNLLLEQKERHERDVELLREQYSTEITSSSSSAESSSHFPSSIVSSSSSSCVASSSSLSNTCENKACVQARLNCDSVSRALRQCRAERDSLNQKLRDVSRQSAAFEASRERNEALEGRLASLAAEAASDKAVRAVWAEWRAELDRAFPPDDKTVIQAQISKDSTAMPPSASGLIRRYEDLKNKELRHLAEKDDAERRAAAAARKVTKLEADLEEAKSERDRALVAAKDLDKEKAALSISERLLKSENRSLIDMMESYERQEGEKAPSGQVSAREGPTVLALKNDIARLEEEASSLRTAADAAAIDRASTVDKFYKLKAELGKERERAAAAEARAATAECLAGKGAYNADETMILHLKENPVSDALRARHAQAIRVLTEAKEALERELEAVRGGGGGGGERSTMMMTPAKTPGGVNSSGADLDVYRKRLTDNYKKMTAIFRDAISQMTGYKVDMGNEVDNISFKVRSIYAESEGDALLFKRDADGRLSLNESEFTKTLDPSALAYLKLGSIPAFLSHLTLDLHSKQTFLG